MVLVEAFGATTVTPSEVISRGNVAAKLARDVLHSKLHRFTASIST